MINSLTDKFSYPQFKSNFHVTKKSQPVSFRGNLSVDTVELSLKNKTQDDSEINLEEIKKQQARELGEFAKNIQNLSRTELTTEKYELTRWSGEIISLETIAKKENLTEAQQLRLDYLKEKLNLIFKREDEIEEKLKPYHPGDTVSEKSAISQHHKIFGLSQSIRQTIESRANNFQGLTESEIKNIQSTEELIEKIDKEFEQLPPLEHDCIVYKGLAEDPNYIIKGFNKPFELMDKAKTGDIVIPDTSYTYTAFERSTAERWGGEGGRHVGKNGEEYRIMMFEIHLPKGAKVSRNWEHRGEILMPRGAQYKIIDKKVLKNGDMEVSLEYILPEK